MKFSEFLLRESTSSLESALKAIRADFRKPNNGIDAQGKKDGDKILDTLLASVSDEKTFSRYYEKFEKELPNTMEFIIDDLLDRMKVDNVDQLFAKVFGVTEAVDNKVYKVFDEWKDAVKKAYPQYASRLKFKGRVEKGVDTISAEVQGIDRCFGVWSGDETGEGKILSESTIRPFKKGDKVKIKKEWQDRDDDKYEWLVVEDEEKGKVTISPKISSMRIQPTQIVMTDMIELDN